MGPKLAPFGFIMPTSTSLSDDSGESTFVFLVFLTFVILMAFDCLPSVTAVRNAGSGVQTWQAAGRDDR